MCLQFSLVLKGEQLEDVFQRQWELWCPAVIEYALQEQNKPAQLKNALSVTWKVDMKVSMRA